jgi:hypothetical protein
MGPFACIMLKALTWSEVKPDKNRYNSLFIKHVVCELSYQVYISITEKPTLIIVHVAPKKNC